MWGSAVQVRPGLPTGVWLSWLEHLLCKQGVAGSNPAISTGARPGCRSPLRGRKVGPRFYDIFERMKQEYKSKKYEREEHRKEVTKGVRGMPWLSEAMKDVISCEKPRGGADGLRSADVRMGQPSPQGLSRKGGEPGELKHLSTRRRRKQQ